MSASFTEYTTPHYWDGDTIHAALLSTIRLAETKTMRLADTRLANNNNEAGRHNEAGKQNNNEAGRHNETGKQ